MAASSMSRIFFIPFGMSSCLAFTRTVMLNMRSSLFEFFSVTLLEYEDVELMLTNQKPNDSVLVVEDDLMLDDSDAVTLDSLALNSTVHSATCSSKQ